MFYDQRGLPLTAANEQAVLSYDATINAYLGFQLTTGTHLKEGLAADDNMPMLHILRGYFMKLFAVPALEDKARQCHEATSHAISACGSHKREQLHHQALGRWCDGDWQGANAAWEQILLDHPTDVLAIRLAHFTHFYSGDARRMRDSAARVLPHWNTSIPGYGYIKGLYAFGLEESGDYQAAERWGREAVDDNPSDIWATHAVTHVFEMQERHDEGMAWIDELSKQWAGMNNFTFHVWWHRALFSLEKERYDEVLTLYDTQFRATQTEEYLDMTNAIAMLWRLESRGVNVGDRWEELADLSEQRTQGHLLYFADAHFIMALARAGRTEAIQEMLASLRQAAQRDDTQCQVIARIGLTLAEAIVSFHEGRFDAAFERLLPARYDVIAIGGSHAQRDLFALVLTEAALQGKRATDARALLAERIGLKPKNPHAWRRYAEALELAGDATAAKTARQRCLTLLSA